MPLLPPFTPPTPLGYFSALVADDVHFPLLEAAASLAQDEYPELDVQQVLADVDKLAVRLRRKVPEDASAVHRLRMLCQFLYRDLGFAGNVNHYHDPENSYLHAVLRTRRGIPVSLAVLFLELAHALQLEAYGVGFPGHFMVKVRVPQGQVIIDPFTGQSLSREDLLERLEPYQRAQGLVDDFEAPLGLFLQPCPPREIVARMLRNLKEIHRSAEDWPRMLAVQERLVRLLPDMVEELRDRGLVFAELGANPEAIADLGAYVSIVPAAADAAAIRDRLVTLRQQLQG